MELPAILETQIQQGKVVLVLGAGASKEARDDKGKTPPNGTQLGRMLADKFLGGQHKEFSLSQIAEHAISESDLIQVQEFIREVFQDFKPTEAHRLMCSFTWHGLATTNYDRLIEEAYRTTPEARQIPKPFIENGDRVEDNLKDPRAVSLLKLHGCISRTANSECPLILTTDQYVEYEKGRSRIFGQLRGWAYELPIVFVGQSLQDPDLRKILLELVSQAEKRPRYYIVAPDFDSIEERFWETKKITPIRSTFGDFLRQLDSRIPKQFRGLAVHTNRLPSPIVERFRTASGTLSLACEQFLEIDVEYVKAVMPAERVSPGNFYKGMNPGWSAIEQNLDVRRHLTDTILADHFLIDEAEHRPSIEVILVKAHAGAGKSILLRRLAWDAAHDYDALCLYLRPHGSLNTALIQELITLCQERVYLFVDNAADRTREVQALIKGIGTDGKHVTLILAERTNEWNVSGSAIAPYIHTVHELKYLSNKEVDSLLHLLQQHRALGTLENQSPEARRAAFADRAGRQLLVALHEATLGKPFENIIEDEYRSIVPIEAQRIYLTICTLNRLDVRVRAGIVSRIHNIPFSEFKERLFGPLEHVVQVEKDDVIRDFTYRARHPHIAQIVFDKILHTQEERYDLYVKCLQELNVDYSSDRSAFRQMVRGRTLIDLFPSHDLANSILGIAQRNMGQDAYLLHQMALYEMHRPNGSLHVASEMLTKALQVAHYDQALTIKHSMAELKLQAAEVARTPLEREKCLTEASALANALKSARAEETYSHHTLVKIGLQRLKNLLAQSAETPPSSAIETLVKDIERNLTEGLQLSPGHPYLLDAEAQLADILEDSSRVLETLERAFKSNPRSTFIALRLANYHKHRGNLSKAKELLAQALEANPSEPRLHYSYAKIHLATLDGTPEILTYHLRRSFTDGDSNYDAQLLYGRQLFINGETDNWKNIFRRLSDARVSPEVRSQLLHPLEPTYKGSVVRLEATYCFISRDGLNDWIYAHRSNINDSAWRSIAAGARVTFRIAFTMRGPSAFEVDLV